MEHVCSSKEDECFLINPNKEKGHEMLNSSYVEEEPPLFLDFPSPFFDEISTKPLSNIITDPPSSESNRLIKKRSVGKKDRHSKIHTAQGLRDRRMRLSLHIARKFFDLQDLLGFDKASKTIEWLFCKSKKAIKEVAENFNPQQHTNNQSLMSYQEMEIKGATRKVEIKKRESIRKRNQHNSRETRDQARARARDRTRERLMIKELEKQLFEGNPKDEIYKLGIGYSASPNNNNHIVEELGSTSSPSQPIQLQHSTSTTHHHFLQELQLANKSIDGFENDSGSNIPEGWQSSIDGFLGVPGEWDANNFITDSSNYGMVPTLTGDIYEQNPSSFFMSITTNILHF